MLLKAEIKSWLNKFQSALFNYSQGFFMLKFESSSPLKMIQSFDKVPFVKHNKVKQEIVSINLVMKVKINYVGIKKGIWLLVSESMHYYNMQYCIYFKKRMAAYFYRLP